MIVMVNGWIKGGYNPDGHFKAAVGADLVIERAASVGVGGWINYYLE
jgi:hypothetical protein